jgi:hypothetical protein
MDGGWKKPAILYSPSSILASFILAFHLPTNLTKDDLT